MSEHRIALALAIVAVLGEPFWYAARASSPHGMIARDLDGPDAPKLVQGNVMPPEKIVDVKPEYPEMARKAGIQGKVILESVIDTEGSVVDVKVQRSIPLLDQAAIDAVRQWRYRPATEYGEPVKVWFTIIVEFALQPHPHDIPILANLRGAELPTIVLFRDTKLEKVFDAIGGSSGIIIEHGEGFPADLRVTIDWWNGVPLKRGLERLAYLYNLQYEVPDPDTLVVSEQVASSMTRP